MKMTKKPKSKGIWGGASVREIFEDGETHFTYVYVGAGFGEGITPPSHTKYDRHYISWNNEESSLLSLQLRNINSITAFD